MPALATMIRQSYERGTYPVRIRVAGTSSKLHYGRCEGGPWNQKDMAHIPDVYAVFVDRLPGRGNQRRPIPGQVAETKDAIKAGEYRFETVEIGSAIRKVWKWYPASPTPDAAT